MKLRATAGKMKSKFLIGKHVTLGLIPERSDLSHYAQWVNDQETTRFMAVGRFPVIRSVLHFFQVFFPFSVFPRFRSA